MSNAIRQREQGYLVAFDPERQFQLMAAIVEELLECIAMKSSALQAFLQESHRLKSALDELVAIQRSCPHGRPAGAEAQATEVECYD